MSSQGGCAVEGPTHWSRAAFADLDRLPRSERARWCVWKSVELLYLLSAQEEQEMDVLPDSMPGRNIARSLAETRWYMEEHLDEPLTIPALSRRACLSALPPRLRRDSDNCMAYPFTLGCGSSGWSVRRNCCIRPD